MSWTSGTTLEIYLFLIFKSNSLSEKGKVTIRNGWLRKPSKKQGFRIDFWQGFRIIFYIAFLSSLQGFRNNFDRVFVSFLQGYRNIKGFSMIFSQMLLTGFHIEISDLPKLYLGLTKSSKNIK